MSSYLFDKRLVQKPKSSPEITLLALTTFPAVVMRRFAFLIWSSSHILFWITLLP
ncbi:hypothetical protein VAE122_3790002 [Vibrio aestuarianus]|nr:hypothetical protein VAE122_3790002 [Vibrio aestuarianus]